MWTGRSYRRVAIEVPLSEPPGVEGSAVTIDATATLTILTGLKVGFSGGTFVDVPGELLAAVPRPQLHTMEVFYAVPLLQGKPVSVQVAILFGERGTGSASACDDRDDYDGYQRAEFTIHLDPAEKLELQRWDECREPTGPDLAAVGVRK